MVINYIFCSDRINCFRLYEKEVGDRNNPKRDYGGGRSGPGVSVVHVSNVNIFKEGILKRVPFWISDKN